MLMYVLIAVAVSWLGSLYAAWRPPGPQLTAAVQHFAAGLVFAAAASELLPDMMHEGGIAPVVVGGGIGIALMLVLRALGNRISGSAGLVIMIGVDVFIDGLVLGLAFAAGARQGLILLLALAVEILFLGLSVSTAFGADTPRVKRLLTAMAIALLLPVGALLGQPVGRLPSPILTGFFAFGLIALLYLVTEELLVEAHEVPENPLSTALFFIGFLLLVVLEEGIPATAH